MANFYDEVVSEEKIVSKSLANIIFGIDEDTRDLMVTLSNAEIIDLAFDVSLFYAALVQAYYFSYAMNKGVALRDVDVLKTEATFQSFKQLWPGGIAMRLTPLSFLQTCENDSRVLTDEAKGIKGTIAMVRDSDREKKRKGYKFYGYDYTHLKKLLRSFKLLSTTEYNDARFIFHVDGEELSINAEPFLIIRKKIGGLEDNAQWKTCAVTDTNAEAFVLSHIEKGNGNYKLTAWIEHINDFSAKPDKIHYDVKVGDNLYNLLRTADISAVWYEDENIRYSANYDLIMSLKKCIVKILKESLAAHKLEKCSDLNNEACWKVLQTLFKGSKSYDSLDTAQKIINENGKLREEYLNNEVLRILLEDGITRTILVLIRNSRNLKPPIDIFDTCINFYCEEGRTIEKTTFKQNCQEEIERHKNLLRHIVQEGSAGYQKRSDEIENEIQADYILKAAGIETNDKVFPDVERVLSIDDYYDKLSIQDDVSIEENLKDVFLFLNTFYRTVFSCVEQDSNADYKSASDVDYQKEAEAISKSLKSYSATELIKAFSMFLSEKKICEKAKKIFGRSDLLLQKSLFDARTNKIIESLQSSKEACPPSQNVRTVFISYAHKDITLVDAIYDRLKKKLLEEYKGKIEIRRDKTEFRLDENWSQEMLENVNAPNNIATIMFLSRNSICSRACHEELVETRRAKKKIIPVNLVPNELCGDWISHEHRRKDFSEEEAHRVNDFWNNFYNSILSVNAYDGDFLDLSKTVEEIFAEIKKNYGDIEQREGAEAHGKIETELTRKIAELYASLKTGEYTLDQYEHQEKIFSAQCLNLENCIFPMVLSLKETRIKRDNVIMNGYEIITKKGEENSPVRYLLTPNKLTADDYYCVPHRERVGNNCTWMVDPILVRADVFKCLQENK